MRKIAKLLCFVFLFTACAEREVYPPVSAEAEHVPGGTIVVGIKSDISTWNPYLEDSMLSSEILGLVYPSLFFEEADYQTGPPEFSPYLAESWEWDESHTVLTVRLSDDAVWSDGTPITAQDVVYTWQVQTDPEHGWIFGYIKEPIQSVTAVGEKQVWVTFNRRYPYQLMNVNDGLVLPAHVFEKVPLAKWREHDWHQNPVSGGPFILGRSQANQYFTLVRNERFWDDVYPDRVVFRVASDSKSLVDQMITGDLDLVQPLSPREAKRILRDPSLRVETYPGRDFTYVGINMVKLPDRKVREALASLINTEEIRSVVTQGYSQPLIGPIPVDMWAHNSELRAPEFDLRRGHQLLREAGWQDRDGDQYYDRTISLCTNSESQNRMDIATLVSENLRPGLNPGVKIEIEPREFGTFLARLDEGECDLFVMGMSAPTDIALDDMWRSFDPEVESYNWTRFADPRVDRLLDQIAEAETAHAMKPLYDEAQRLIVEAYPAIWLWQSIRLVGVSNRIKVQIDATGVFTHLPEWWVPPDRRKYERKEKN